MSRIKVFTNGCFDLFHDGHRYLLNTILDLFGNCILNVAINSDRSVRELKGDGRPRMSAGERADAICMHVDSWCQKNMEYPELKINVFNTEDILCAIMERFNPDVIVKGNDREIKDVKGSDNWPVLIIPRLKNSSGNYYSTTNILKNGHER